MRRLLIVISFVAGCRGATSPLPAGAERFQPPAVYAQWWELTESCSGVSGDFSRVAWYHVPNAETIPDGEGGVVNGLWQGDGNRIILAGSSVEAGDLVRHEMLHALLHRGNHPRPMFITRCRGTVVCTDQCIKDAGRPPPPDPASIAASPTSLQVDIEVLPTAPGVRVNDGFFMLIVSARNPAPYPVIAQLRPSGDYGPNGSFGYVVRGRNYTGQYDLRAEVPEDSEFAPHQTKIMMFDFHVGPGTTRYDQRPGVWRFDGAYGGVGAPEALAVVIDSTGVP